MTREFDAAALTRRDDADRDLMLAYQTAVFATQAFNGKLEDVRTLLARRHSTHRRQTIAEQRHVLMQLSEQYGIPLKEQVH